MVVTSQITEAAFFCCLIFANGGMLDSYDQIEVDHYVVHQRWTPFLAPDEFLGDSESRDASGWFSETEARFTNEFELWLDSTTNRFFETATFEQRKSGNLERRLKQFTISDGTQRRSWKSIADDQGSIHVAVRPASDGALLPFILADVFAMSE